MTFTETLEFAITKLSDDLVLVGGPKCRPIAVVLPKTAVDQLRIDAAAFSRARGPLPVGQFCIWAGDRTIEIREE